jgi:hypothetical protein
MNDIDERRLRSWLAARDPGPARAALREAVRAVPFTHPGARFPGLSLTLRAGFGLGPIARPIVIIVALLLAIVVVAGTLVVQPWRPFPPPGLIGYVTSRQAPGSSGINLVAADGTGLLAIGADVPNRYDHAPRWSRDGRTLLFARTSGLDPLGACGGAGSVVLYDVATGTERVVASGLRPINVLEWSPSEHLVAYTYPPPGCGAQVELGVVDLTTGAVTTTVVVPAKTESDATQDVLWHVEWTGEVASAVPDFVITSDGPDFTRSVDVASHAGDAVIRYASTTPAVTPTLTLIDLGRGTRVELGAGGLPRWAPDDSAIAFMQPGGSAGPDLVDDVRDHLVIAAAATGALRVVADALMPDGLPGDVLPTVFWTTDASAVYWVDVTGVHVVDVVTGRIADLTAIGEGCSDLQWQPLTR